jgi:hypothetical protein
VIVISSRHGHSQFLRSTWLICTGYTNETTCFVGPVPDTLDGPNPSLGIASVDWPAPLTGDTSASK